MKILGIETSCDETSAGIIDFNKKTKEIILLANITATSLPLHAKTGGIIPEIAAREQVKYIIPTINEALIQSCPKFYCHSKQNKKSCKKDYGIPDIDAIAVTYGPGLIGSLLVGVETAKTLSFLWNKPLIPINHLYGHIYANFINPQKPIANDFPAIGLIVSGGHTDLIFMKNAKTIQWIGGTRDDAAGEAFDKIGRFLGLAYPAGAEIEKMAKNGNPKAFRFPRPLLNEATYDFSFSGLKTAVTREAGGKNWETKRAEKFISEVGINENNQLLTDLCRGTQDAIIEVLTKKTLKAVDEFNAKSILIGGGVASNQTLIENFKRLSLVKVFAPKKSLCTDNGAMIASAAIFNLKKINPLRLEANPELYFDKPIAK